MVGLSLAPGNRSVCRENVTRRTTMSRILRLMSAGLIVLGGWAAPPRHGQATDLAATANRVFGQPDFISDGPNYGRAHPTPHNLPHPNRAAADPHLPLT